MKSSLQAGAGKAAIQIPESFFPYSSFKGRYFTGQHDDIFVRCILVKNAETSFILVSIELGDFGEIAKWQQRISQRSGVPEQNIYITVTHNHVAPHVSDDWNQEVKDVEKTADFGRYTWEAMACAIDQARSSLRPATVSYGTGKCDININRDYMDRPRTIIGYNPRGLSDKTVAVVKFDDLEGKTIALFINYAVHGAVMMGVTFKDGGMNVSGDLPGFTSRYVEEAYGNETVALWTSGCAGDQNPRYMGKREPLNCKFEPGKPPMFDDEPSLGEAAYLLVKVQAEELADEVLYVAWEIDNEKDAADIRSAQHIYQVPGQKKPGPPRKYDKDFRYDDDAPPVPLWLSVLKLNDIIFVGIPGELVTSVGLMIKEVLAERTRKVIVVTHCNGSISYMSDTVGFATRSGEALRTHVSRGWAERAIVDGVLELLGQLEDAESPANVSAAQ